MSGKRDFWRAPRPQRSWFKKNSSREKQLFENWKINYSTQGFTMKQDFADSYIPGDEFMKAPIFCQRHMK